MKNQPQDFNILNDEEGHYILQEGQKYYLQDVEEGSNWLNSQEVNKIIELYCEKEPEEVLLTNEDQQIKNFKDLFTNQNISLSTLDLNETKHKFYIFTNGAFFGYAFLIDDKFAHIDYAFNTELFEAIINENKYVTENNLPLQKNTISHNGSCGLGTATDICEIIEKINKGTDDLEILQWLKSKTPDQERKLTVGGEKFSTNSWDLATKNSLVKLTNKNQAVALTNKYDESKQNETTLLDDLKSLCKQVFGEYLSNAILSNLNQKNDEDKIKILFNLLSDVGIKEAKEQQKTQIEPKSILKKNNGKKQKIVTFSKDTKDNKKEDEKKPQNNPQSNNQIIINQDNKPLDYPGFEVVICDNKTIKKPSNQQKIQTKSTPDEKTPGIPDIKEDIDYAFCKQNQQNNQPKALKPQNNTNLPSHNFGFRFNSEAGKLIKTVNEGAGDEEKNKAWEELLKNHDTVIFKLASDKENYIRFYLNRGKDRKIEFAFDEFLFSRADALELSIDFTKYDKIKAESTTKISKDERFDIYLYCKSGPKETDKDNEVLKAEFNSNNQQPQNKISNISLDKKTSQLVQ